MLGELAAELDEWMATENVERRANGRVSLRPCRIRAFGQAALFEYGLELPLVVTRDVDVVADYEFAVESEFRKRLAQRGFDLDPAAREAWMPPETDYAVRFCGAYVTLELADVESILISKGLLAPAKNMPLLVEYLARAPTERFFDLAAAHGLDWEHLK